jgi:hypothetical protein
VHPGADVSKAPCGSTAWSPPTGPLGHHRGSFSRYRAWPDQGAINALKLWRFKPGTKEGKAVAVRVKVEMTLTLK